MRDFIKKEKYESPVIEIVEFETEDIITTSGSDEDVDIDL